jgi:predicted DNA-binding ribbon-helix-helix protein
MTVDQLIAEARVHRKGAPEPLTMENLAQALRMMIGHALKSTDVEAEPSSSAAQTARLLAMLVAAIEDQQAH